MTISRTLFRNGASEYAINGDVCRLLDVQELLSDSGLGREMHVIVGQGRLDSVLQASPEERRGFIEEAAGILKHRRRKEKTLRKLEAMEANLTRLSDLAGELRRQLKPLGRQAEIAREAATIAAVVRDAKARLLADELVGLRSGARRSRAQRAGASHRATRAAGPAREHSAPASSSSKRSSDPRASTRRGRSRSASSGCRSACAACTRSRGSGWRCSARTPMTSGIEVTTVSQAMIDEARAEIDEIAAGLGDAQDAAAEASRDVIRARAELDALDTDIAAQSALVSEHDMRITALRGSAEAAASALAAVRAASSVSSARSSAALARRAEAEAALAGVDPDLVPEGSAAEYAAAYDTGAARGDRCRGDRAPAARATARRRARA